ncbi:MAG: flagellar basal-body rod protein FlgG [Verrucomicrobiota bacterium]|nr:flagellar basal-body rod protein FlgG [Verrucomicrobiota bacterium]
MSISLYSAASGMEAQQTNLNVISNNIANVNTTGFKKSKVEFQDMFYQVPKSVGADSGGSILPTGIQVGSGTQVVATSKVFTQGQVNRTDEELDVAIVGDGFFSVENENGDTLYTRDGGFKRGPTGQLTTSQGMTLEPGITVPTEANAIVINEGGIITFLRDSVEVGTAQLQLSRFNNPAGLAALGGNLFRETSASGEPELGDPGTESFGTIRQGFLENSNVNIVQEMVNMIVAQRAYEINSKSIQTSDQMMQQTTQLKR